MMIWGTYIIYVVSTNVLNWTLNNLRGSTPQRHFRLIAQVVKNYDVVAFQGLDPLDSCVWFNGEEKISVGEALRLEIEEANSTYGVKWNHFGAGNFLVLWSENIELQNIRGKRKGEKKYMRKTIRKCHDTTETKSHY